MNKSKLIRWSVPVAVLVLLWVIPTPEGLTPAAWHMFAIFTATIAGILAAPVASGALMFIALAITYFTNTLPLNDVLKGFASGTVWIPNSRRLAPGGPDLTQSRPIYSS